MPNKVTRTVAGPIAARAAAAILALALSATPVAVHADPSTGRLRTLDCGAAGVLEVDLGPAQFLTTTSAAIHVLDSTKVLVPQRVAIVRPDGSRAVTLDKHAANVGGAERVTCSYTDPAGLRVIIVGALH